MQVRNLLPALPLLLLTACKKDYNPEDYRLTGFSRTANGNVVSTDLVYNSEGRVSTIRFNATNPSSSTDVKVIHSGNTVLFVEPPVDDQIAVTDSTWMELNGDGMVTRKIHHSFFEVRPQSTGPSAPRPLRTYTRDTLTFNYNSQGLITGAVHGKLDSTWSQYPSYVETSTSRTVGSRTYTNEGGQLKRIAGQDQILTRMININGVFTNSGPSSFLKVFEYGTAQANSLDFRHAAVLEYLNFIAPDFPINRNYTALPTSVRSSDSNSPGDVTTTFQYTYNKYGLLSSSAIDNGYRTHYYYSK